MKWPEDYINKVIQGDCLKVLKAMPDDKVDMIMTSPPYWGLRDYGVPGQLGLEPTFHEYLDKVLAITAELKRVLRTPGSFYLNMGDTYGGNAGGYCSHKGELGASKNQIKRKTIGLEKCLCGIPWRLALQAVDKQDWILRNAIIWHKPNPMPSSVRDRLSNTYEFMFHFVKSQKYYYDLNAIREPHIGTGGGPGFGANALQQNRNYEQREHPCGKNPGDVISANYQGKDSKKQTQYGQYAQRMNDRRAMGLPHDNAMTHPMGKNPGDFWDITTQPFSEAHFATFPEKLCEKPIKSSCPAEICKKCGKARERITKPTEEYAKKLGKSWHPHLDDKSRGQSGLGLGHRQGVTAEYQTIGWTDCGCKAGFEPGVVLDPFAGAGTTCLVAQKLSNKYIGIEINPDYIKIAEKRLAQETLF